ncbi:hypothetical protein COI53_25615 [Bacillus thuringiensis]|uniref:OmpA family protein n=1 Tax=Bacillus thuringiensis TaxID=1428 RepID=UPI000BF3535A|nr:OmpA family protein [Bacillus thuringiensis]PFI27079.1 hypothetical protein COI53_25615 [Bacillus thuringiensis]
MKVIPKEITVFNFPQYGSEINALPPEEKLKMDTLALEFANSFLYGTTPILAFIIIGHADQDAQGADFEMQVSIARAESAQTWLVQQAKNLVQQGGGDPLEVDFVEFSLSGYGASNLYTQDSTFPARLMNRRVVIKYAGVELNPIPEAGFIPNLTRATILINQQPDSDEIKRIRCVLSKLVNPIIDDTYFIWEEMQHYRSLDGKTDEQILLIARELFHSLRSEIANNAHYGPDVPDDLIVNGLIQWDFYMNTTINTLYKRLNHDQSVTGKLHESIARFIGRNMQNPNSIWNCYL